MKLIFFLVLIIPCLLFAQDFNFEPSQADWNHVVAQIRDFNGKSDLVLLFSAIQILYFIFRTAIGDVLGSLKFLILADLSMIVTIGLKIMEGQHFINALMDPASLMTYQVVVHEYTNYKRRKRDHLNAALADTSPSIDVSNLPL